MSAPSKITEGKIKLDSSVAERLKRLYNESHTTLFALAKLASQIRSENIDRKTGNYYPEFSTWWAENKLEEVFGKKANFSKYATAGDGLMGLERHNIGESKFPTSVRTLYEIGRLPTEKLEVLKESPQIIHPNL